MLRWLSDATTWSNQCKPPTTTPSPAPPPDPNKPPKVTNEACTNAAQLGNVAVAQQLLTGYTSLITTANDGSGSPAILSILRGKMLSDAMSEGIPSLQLSVVAAGGSTKTNNIALVNLGYVFAPSYNAGAIATYELRDENNILLTAGYRQILYNYTKYHLHNEDYDSCQDEGDIKGKRSKKCP